MAAVLSDFVGGDCWAVVRRRPRVFVLLPGPQPSDGRWSRRFCRQTHAQWSGL